jgi:hypothetical protein
MNKINFNLKNIRIISISSIIILFLFAISTNLYSAGLKKVLILDFNNIENNPNHEYLISSITDAVRKMLKDRFAFRETEREKWEKVADDNYIFKSDFYTKTAAINLGLLAMQDIVISGAYKVYSKKGQKGLIIETSVRIIDISEKKVISEFMIDGPADNRIWDSINMIAERISKEAQTILPNKEEWKRLGIEKEEESLPYITDVNFGIRVGGFLYHSGWSKYFEERQPTIGLILRGNTPFIWEYLAFEVDFYFMNHSLKEGERTRAQSLDLQGNTANYFLCLFVSSDVRIIWDLLLCPKIGGGYVLQVTTVTGEASDNFTNNFPFAGLGIELLYELNKFVDVSLTAQEFVEFEEKIRTYVSNVNLGLNLKF